MKTNMRKSIFASFTLAALAALLLTGCEREKDMTGKPVEFSAGISDNSAGTRSGLPGTRVVYGETTETGDSKQQSLDWEEGDELTIYCAQCTKVQTDVEAEKHVSDYVVTEVNPDETGLDSYAAIGTPGPDVEGLQWGTGSHTFYAVYPKADGTGTTINGKDIAGVIPAEQGFTEVSGTDDQIVAPDMNNMYMVSKAGTYEPDASPVTLVFQPLSTALEFTITNKFDDNKKDMVVKSVTLVSDNHVLNGGFKVDMDQTGLYYGRPLTTLDLTGDIADADKTVTMDFGDGIAVPYEGTLTFTFFLNPGNATEVDDLTFEISGTNKYHDSPFTRRARLEDKDGHGVKFPTHQKTRIGGVMVPESIGWEIQGELSVEAWKNGGKRKIKF